jgi:hypothetical protein
MSAPHNFFGLAKPIDILNKAKRELERLEKQVHIDHVYNFFTTAYHVQDYVKKGTQIPISEVNNFLKNQDLIDCRDICDKGKHLKLTHNGRHDPLTIIYDNTLSGNTPLGSFRLDTNDEWILESSDGRKIEVVALAYRVIQKWELFLSQHPDF